MGYTVPPLTIADKKILRGETPTEQDYENSLKEIIKDSEKTIRYNNISMAIAGSLFILMIIITFVIYLCKANI